MYKSRESQARTLACDRGAKPWLCACKAHVQKPRVMGKDFARQKRSPRYQSGVELAGEGALTYANAISFSPLSFLYPHATEAPNHGFAYAKPMYKSRESWASIFRPRAYQSPYTKKTPCEVAGR